MTVPRPVTIVVLAKYKEIFEPFLKSLTQYVDKKIPLTVVFDGKSDILSFTNVEGREAYPIMGPEKFSMAGNGNLGLKSVPADHDILYCGDDVRFLQERTVENLQDIAYAHPEVGILSPRIIGRGSPAQVECKEFSYVKPLEMWFPCIYIKRELINKIGFLDEQFSDFGCDDFDYCIRTLQAGYKLAVCKTVAIQHESSPEGGPTTFVKTIGVENWRKQEGKAQEKIKEKYKISNIVFNEFLRTGDIDLLRQKSSDEHTGLECSQSEAKEFLKTKTIFLATPVYGGNSLTVNYVHSLMTLINMCRDFGVGLNVSFMYNESLITRARNKMVYDFRQTQCTHFLFIDADISFDARDVIMLLLQKEEVIGAPCVRKNLRWDRIINTVKQNGKEYTGEELQKITGEYVVNFPHNQAPTTINLGKMIEVLDVGTGLMMVKREVFDKLEKDNPNNWYLQMHGEEGGRVPMHMFFQAQLDEESRNHNPGGYADYISEDYQFCRSCKKSGIKVWLAPFMKTEHLGSYLYKGDLQAVALAGGGLR